MSGAAAALAALGRGDIWRALALALDYPAPETAAAVEGLLADLMAEPSRAEAMPLPPALRELATIWSAGRTTECQSAYHRLFDTQGSIGYCESAWRHTERGAVLRDVTGFYRAFGCAARPEHGQADSIRHELAFMAHLAYKEWFALEHGEAQAAATAASAQALFLAEHLVPWAATFAARLAQAAEGTPYAVVAEVLAQWLDAERLRCGIAGMPAAEPPAGELADPLGGGCPVARA